MSKYVFKIVDNHIIVNIDKKLCLLDTGAPNSVGQESLKLIDKDYPLVDNYMGLTTVELSKHIGENIDVLLGADILENYCVTIDWKEKKIEFLNETIKNGDTEMPIELFMGIPIIEIEVNDKMVKCFFDTGAKLSYVNPEYLNNKISERKEKDFYPGVGEFETDVYKLPIKIGTTTLVMKFGILPELLQTTLMLAGTQGIIGNDIFNMFNKVSIDYLSKKLIM